MGLRRARLIGIVWGWAILSHASDEYKKWLNSCAREGFTAIFKNDEYTVQAPRGAHKWPLEAQAVISHGRVDDKPRITMNLHMRQPNGDRHSQLRGAEQYERILDFFEGEYVGINGLWYERDNLAEFNRLTGEGLSLEEAARNTWTGRQAAKHGFTDVHVDVDELKGVPGAYREVSVYFDRPGGRLAPRKVPVEVSLNYDKVEFSYTTGPHRYQSIRGQVDKDVLVLEVVNRSRSLPDAAREHVREILEFFKGRYRDVRYKLTGNSKRMDRDPVDEALREYGLSN